MQARSPHPCGSRPCAAPPARPLTQSGGSARHGKKKEEQEQRQKLHSGLMLAGPTPCPTSIREISSTHGVDLPCRPRSIHTGNRDLPAVTGKLSGVGRCELAGPLAPWARGMPRAGWAGRPTPVLPCAQDSAHEQGAIEPPGVRALCLRSTASQAPERTAASGWAGPRSGVYGVSCQPTPPRHPPGSSCCYCGCRPAAGATAGAGRQPAQAPKRSSSIVISGAAPDWIAAAWLSVRGSTRAK